MQLITRIFFTLILLNTLAACSGGSGSSSPSIGNLYTDIYHSHSSFYDKWGISPNSRIEFTISVEVSDPQGLENLAYVYVSDKNQDWYWDLLNTDDNLPLEEYYVEDTGAFERTFYKADKLDSVNLTNWEIVVGDKDGNETRRDFEFTLPGGAQVHNERFIYSSEYTGSKTNGIPALEVMTIDDNNLVFTSNPGTQSFHIEFDVTDERAKHYEFAFYDGTANLNYIGYVCTCSPSIESTPIVTGQTLVIDLPWSEIDFVNGHAPRDVNGLHIKLFDEPVDWVTPRVTGLWFNYISYSEFVTLD